MLSVFHTDLYRLSQEELIGIAKNPNCSLEDRSFAVFFIKCPDALKDIARNTSNRTLLKTILEYLIDQKEFLVDLSANHPDWQIRLMSISHIINDYYFRKDCDSILESKEYDEYASKPDLVDMAFDDDYRNRLVATLFIDDVSILTDIALNDENSHVRIAAISGIGDEGLLADIIRRNANINVIKFAVSKISSDSKLISLYREGHDNRRVISNIRNQTFLLNEVLSNAFDWTLCSNAVQNIHTQKVLHEIVKHYAKPDFEEPREAFMSYSDDYTYLDDFLKRVIGMIVDDGLLADLAFNHDDMKLWRHVADNILNPSILEDIVLSYPVDMSRMDFIHITDGDALFEIALNHPIENTRKYAVRRIFERDRLRKIIGVETSDEVKKIAFDNLKLEKDDFTLDTTDVIVFAEVLKTVDDDSKLLEIFHKYRNFIVKQVACETIGDEELLRDIALRNYIVPACFAINNISSEEIILDIALNACFERTRTYAISKINDDEMLKHIFENSDSYSSRLNALSRISDSEYLARVASDLLADGLQKRG